MSTHIPLDIQLQLIERLPIKSLIRFRSVCKAWSSFIDCSEFISAYNFRHDQSEHLVVRYKVGDWKETEVKYVCFVDDDSFPQQKLDLTVPPLVQVTIPIGSSHGLLCLIGYLREPHGSCLTSETLIVVIWNPAIRRSISVAVPYVAHPLFACVIGFGVCPDTKDPKLVKITYISDKRKMESISCIPCQVMVFTLSSGEWTPSCSNKLPRKSIDFDDGFQTVIGQFIYWRAYDWSDVDGEPRNLIMSFDMSTEEFREVDLPDSLARKLDMSVSRLGESIALIEYTESTLNKKVCDVWIMEHGDPKVFTKLFTVNAPNASVSKILEFRKNGEPIVEMLDFVTPSALVVYDPCLKHIMDLGIRGYRHSSFANSYTESLLLLNHDDGYIYCKCQAVKR